jgi:prepilin-type processing-associated H-X9-DG protein
MYTSYMGVAGASNDPGAAVQSYCCEGSGYINGGSGILGSNTQVKMVQITDGTSNTIMAGEQSDFLRDAANQPILSGAWPVTSQGPHGWTMGSDLAGVGVANQERQFNIITVRWEINRRGLGASAANGTNFNSGSNFPFSSAHSGGAMMLFGDGGVRFLRDSTTLAVLQALASKDRGEVLPDF